MNQEAIAIRHDIYQVLDGLPALVFLAVLAAGIYLAHWTRFGRNIYAVGGNESAAHLSGIHVNRTRLLAFVLAGLAAAIAGVLMAARLNSGSPNYGVGLELAAIAAAVIGGASLAGGRGPIVGTIVGTLLISFLRNGCTMLDISTNVQPIVIGATIIVAVALDQLARPKAESAG